MVTWEKGLILSICFFLWDYVILIFKNSFVYRVCMYFWNAFTNSLIYRALNVEDGASKAWESSKLGSVMEFLLNIAPLFAHFVYRSLGDITKNSHLLRHIEALGKYSAGLISLGVFAMLVMPYGYWNNTYGLFLAVVAYFLFALGSLSSPKRLRLSVIGAWTIIFFIVTSLSFIWSLTNAASLRFLVFSVTCFMLVILFVNATEKEESLFFAIKCLALGLFLCALYAVRQWFVGIEFNPAFTDIALNAGMPGRAYSFFVNPNSFAKVLVLFTPLMLSMSFFAPKWRQKLAFFVVFCACSIALVMTYSRGGWVAFAFSVLIMMLMLCARWVPLFGMVGLGALPFLPGNILSRVLTIFNFADTSTMARTELYSAIVRLIYRYPIFGVGLGAGAVRHAMSTNGLFRAYFPFIHGHNIYLQIWAESGILAIIAFGLAMFMPMRSGIKVIKNDMSPILRGVISGSVAGLSGMLVFGLIDFNWAFPRVMMLHWFLFAVLCASLNIHKNSADNERIVCSHGK